VKRGVLVAAFGSLLPEGRSVHARIEAMVRDALPGVATRTGLLSRRVLAGLRERGEEATSVRESAEALLAAGCPELVVLPVLFCRGREREILEQDLSGIPFRCAGTLLDRDGHADGIARILLSHRAAGVPNAIAVHGNARHPSSEALLRGLKRAVARLDPSVGMASVEPMEGMEPESLAGLARGAKVLRVIPALIGAGRHLREDIADGWPARVGVERVECAPTLGETPAAIDLLRERLEEAWR
jgi:sirohydrochlorin cobaltochelatase